MDERPAPRADAEPGKQHADPTAAPVQCPFCRSTDTELLSLFGSQLSTTQYYCRACHTPFEYVKYAKENPQPGM